MSTNKKGFAIASLIMGILSMTICCLAGSVFGLIGLIFGIISLCRKESRKGLAIGGMITSCIGIVVGVVLILLIGNFAMETTEEFAEQLVEKTDTYEIKDVFAGTRHLGMDDSMIYFEEDGTFVWYQSDDDHDDNYWSGTYESYYGQEAMDYLTSDLQEYGVTEDELEDYFDRNADDEVYAEENFCVLVLHKKQLVKDHETEEVSNDTPYMGFYENGYYDCASMNSSTYFGFTLQE